MKTIKFLGAVLMVSVLFSCNNKNGVSNEPLKTEIDSVSYAIGMSVAQSVEEGFIDFDNDRFIQGYLNTRDSSEVLIEKSESQKLIQTYLQKIQPQIREKQEALAAKRQAEALKEAEVTYHDNKVAGENFLEENKEKEGVQTTASGLQYTVLKEGNGDKPKATSRVKVHYHGTTIDGEVFDSSLEKDPIEFGLNGVIRGWTEGLQLMSPGAKYKFFVPQELAYGANPRPGGKIKPFDALIFEVELLEVK